MHFHYRALMMGAMWMASMACSPDVSPTAVVLDTRQFPLIEGTNRLQISVYEGARDCTVILLGGRRPGVYNLDVALQPNLEEYQEDFFDVVPGQYTAAAWALGDRPVPLGFACTETPVTIEAGRQSQLVLVLQPIGN